MAIYQHDPLCPAKRFTPPNPRGLRTCLDCAGIFDAAGKGIDVLDRRLDADYVIKAAELEAENAIHKARRG